MPEPTTPAADKRAPRGLLAGSMMTGAVSATAAALIALPVPNPWRIPVYVVLAVAFCMITGRWRASRLAERAGRADG